MGNKAHLGCGFLLDFIRQVRSQILEAASPIVWKEIGVKAVNLQPQLQFQIRQQEGARGVIRRCGSIELERCQLAQRDLDRIDPQDVFDAEQARFSKRGSHDAGQDQNARSAANRPRGSIPSQIAKPVIVVGTKVVFEQPPAFACEERTLQLIGRKTESGLLCWRGWFRPSCGWAARFLRLLLFSWHGVSVSTNGSRFVSPDTLT